MCLGVGDPATSYLQYVDTCVTRFIQLLGKPNQPVVVARVKKLFGHSFSEAVACETEKSATSLYELFAGITSRTVALNRESGDAAYQIGGHLDIFSSTKGYVKIVQKDTGEIFVLKYIKDRNADNSTIVEEANISTALRNANSALFENNLLLEYTVCSLPAARGIITGVKARHCAMTLKDLIKTTYCLSDPLVLRYACAIVTAMQAVHDIGFVMNDIKPSNCFLLQSGALVLADLGGVQPIGNCLVEYSESYMPKDLIDGGISKCDNDVFCAVNTVLELVGQGCFCPENRACVFSWINTHHTAGHISKSVYNKLHEMLLLLKEKNDSWFETGFPAL